MSISLKVLLLLALFIALQFSSALNLQKQCSTNTDCKDYEECSFQQICTSEGCQKSQKKQCISVGPSSQQFTRAQQNSNYLSQSYQQSENEQIQPQLIIKSSKDKDSLISFEKKGDQQQDHTFKMGLQGLDNDFVISKGENSLLVIDAESGDVRINKNLKITEELKLGLQSQIVIGKVPQWIMIHEEVSGQFDLSKWTLLNGKGKTLKQTKCGGYTLLGGYGELSLEKLQTQISLANYKYSNVKIEAVFHFIDAWSGQTAYMRLPHSEAYLWTDSFDFTQTKNTLNLCGSDIGEGKFSSQIEAVFSSDLGIDKESNTLTVEFGTTLETDAQYSSYGISSLRVYIR
ncbi:UNKNOWN [Stylonychia lemnae]|uniref:Uncharacterized protein n=1 Tax=Stylonychia lemnae TaxID=5949 RepID=A0A078A3H3_STYLE|nr:UNKNOWN [Stylonychia lemnae]|eukprot:CDW76727.1 UNKNOWN [Stylonychia lemnae]